MLALCRKEDYYSIRDICDGFIAIPACEDALSCVYEGIALQLFAYHIAKKRDCDIDKPRNLAKSVTVE